MDMLLKTIAAFAIGAGALIGAQQLWLSSIMAQIRSSIASSVLPQTQFKPAFEVDPDKFRAAIMPKPPAFDTKPYEALGVRSAQRQIDIQIRNAQSAVPVPRTFSGMPRR